jgi:hypothetical protein
VEANRLSQIPNSGVDALLQARVVYVATVRKDGTQSAAAPLWFTTTPDRRIVIQSGPNSWHVRRIRRGSPLLVWISSLRGLAFIARAELSNDPLVIEQIIRDYPRKYLMARLGLHRPTKSSFVRAKRLAIVITLLRPLPEGFTSEPGLAAPQIAELPVNIH